MRRGVKLYHDNEKAARNVKMIGTINILILVFIQSNKHKTSQKSQTFVSNKQLVPLYDTLCHIITVVPSTTLQTITNKITIKVFIY